MVRVKVCCISSIEEAHRAIRLGASALGLVSRMPSGPGVISEALIAQIAAAVPPPIATFLLTSLTDPDEIIAQQRRCETNTIQFCDRLASGTLEKIRKALPGVSFVQVIHVVDESSVVEAVEASSHADVLLLDSGNQLLPVKELGGTGRTHDWTLSAKIVRKSKVPIFLAGGLNPDNVSDAIRAVRPFAVDLCSGVRTSGKLDERKLDQFMNAVAAA